MKKINVTSPSMPPMEEYFEEVKSIWENRWLTNAGPKHQILQKNLEEYLGVEHVELFANGHLALEIALDALGLKGEVITTPFTFASTTQAIVRNGLKPVFCDVEPKYYTMDPAKIEPLINEKTCAILPVHVYGNVCDVDAIEKIARKYNLRVIYDAAHTFGVKVGGRGIGAYGDVSMFSFHATKVFNTVEGGGLTFADDELVAKCKAIRQFGQKDETDVPYVGTNAKMTEFHAAMGICNLRHVEDNIRKRRQAVERYRERLCGVGGIRICTDQEGVQGNYAYFPALFDEKVFGKSRDDVAELLAQNNIFARKYFYPLTNTFACLGEGYSALDTPVAADIALHVLTLPLYADLELCDVDRICDIILG
ncbi:MAG: DegT/DnrJ/EryC1/StrS family aminotransferase [Clostridia bacterium]|nr:DegT/DnrJ/EryC1/StrS family aminotransferase [Clostridia bacterium]